MSTFMGIIFPVLGPDGKWRAPTMEDMRRMAADSEERTKNLEEWQRYCEETKKKNEALRAERKEHIAAQANNVGVGISGERHDWEVSVWPSSQEWDTPDVSFEHGKCSFCGKDDITLRVENAGYEYNYVSICLECVKTSFAGAKKLWRKQEAI